jgi:MSHA biogenesis protein MshQ
LNFQFDCVTNCYASDFSSQTDVDLDWATNSSQGSFGAPRIVDSGKLRFTDQSRNNATIATLLRAFPARNNFVEVEFTHYAYGGNGADGIAVVLSNANIRPDAGGYGGSLGYAQRSGIDGFAGGWLGVGIDEYGNFSNGSEGRNGGVGRQRESVSLRGSGSGQTGYPFLFSTRGLSPGVDVAGSTPGPAHRYRISIDNSTGGRRNATARVERDTGSGFQDIVPRFRIRNVNADQSSIPNDLYLSFTGSTGGATNIHEIGDLKVCSIREIESLKVPHHYHISHSGTGLTCEEEPVTITAHDRNHAPFKVTRNTTLTLSSSPSFDSVRPTRIRMRRGRDSVVARVRKGTPIDAIDIDVTDGFASDIDGDAVEDPPLAFADAAFRFYADGVVLNNQNLATQIAGKANNVVPNAQDLTVALVETDTLTGACVTNIRRNRNIEFGFVCENPSSCVASSDLTVSARNTRTIDGTDFGDPLNYTTVGFRFSNQGEAPFSFNYEDAGAISLHARFNIVGRNGLPDILVEGESPPIIVRPFALHMDVSGQRETDLADDGQINESFNASKDTVFTSIADDARDSKFVKAGENFAVDLRAVAWDSADDSNLDGLPDIGARLANNATTPNFGRETSSQSYNFDASLVLPSGGLAGALESSSFSIGGGSTSFSSGRALLNASYSEVGIIDALLDIPAYLGTSQALVRGMLEKVGRFTPSYFDLRFSQGAFSDACDSFSYLGQPFGYNVSSLPSLELTARNADGDVTQNYSAADFMNLLPTGITRTFPIADATQLDTSGALVSVQHEIDALYPDGRLFFGLAEGLSNGVVRYEFSPFERFTYTKSEQTELAPFSSDLEIALSALADTDDVTSNTLGSWLPLPASIRVGRWSVESVVGSSSQSLAVPAFTEYLAASGDYTKNVADACTVIGAALQVLDTDGNAVTGDFSAIKVGNGQSALTYSSPLSSGDGGFSLSAPNDVGTLTIESDLSALPWLRSNWLGAGLDDPQPATAQFGQFRGHDRLIFWRELGVSR